MLPHSMLVQLEGDMGLALATAQDGLIELFLRCGIGTCRSSLDDRACLGLAFVIVIAI